jgi:predicted small lipoprotein YifL
MNRRHLLAAGGLLALVLLAGCGLGPSEIPDEELNENVSFDWDTDAKATFSLSRSSYTAVIQVSNESTIQVFRRDALGTDTPVQPNALQFRFLNGTVVNATHGNLSASLQNSATEITVPADNGTLGYAASRSGKQFATPVFVEGSHELVLPPGARIGVPLLSQASPGGYGTSVSDNRMTVRWDELEDGTINVRYYLQRDLFIFSGLVGLVLILGVGGSIYYLREIRQLEEQREEMGIDVDEDDDVGDGGPPPGMG